MRYTLIQLLKEYRVIIPILQRDYVQGSNDDHATKVRDNLITDLKAAFESRIEPLDLHFIYGKPEGEFLFPVDGQQRLTTLFLLHLYAFSDCSEGIDFLNHFSYQARNTTRDFITAIVFNKKILTVTNQTIKDAVMDEAWFLDSWKYDPSIVGMLTVFNDFQNKGFNRADLRSQLLNSENPRVFFQFLPLEQLGKEDDLYIKLNARGRALTSFENFKSKLIARFSANGSLLSQIKRSLDTGWSDLIWEEGKAQYDELYLKFFSLLFSNNGLLDFKTSINSESYWIYDFDFKLIEESILHQLHNTFNYLCSNRKTEIYNLVFDSLKKKEPSYSDGILFYAVTSYLIDKNENEKIDNNAFSDWIRVIRNLVENSRIDESDIYSRAIKGINSLLPWKDDILSYLATSNLNELTGFSKEQVEEEKIKARIMIRDDAHKQSIIEVERKLPYFKGNIISVLFLSDFVNNDDFSLLMKYANIEASLFDADGPRGDGILLRQALCVFGDYRISVGYYKTLCVDDPNERLRTPSLKQLFSHHGNEVSLLLNSLVETEDVEAQLRTIVESSSIPQNDWRYCFINYRFIFDIMSPYQLRMFENEAPILVPNKSSSGYNYSLYLIVLQHILKEKKGIESEYLTEFGWYGNRQLIVGNMIVKYNNNAFEITNEENSWSTKCPNVFDEVVSYIVDCYKNENKQDDCSNQE